MAVQIQLRRDTSANWASVNPILTQGEPGYEINTGKWKVGDGTTAWNSLAYQAAANIVDGTIVDADINASAAIALSKLATGALPSGITVASVNIVDGTIVNADVNASAAIDGTKISPNFGGQTITTSGVFSHALGAVGAPTVTFSGDSDTGIYSPGANQLAITTSGVSRVYVGSTGSVGIGTSSPAYRLNIAVASDASLATGADGFLINTLDASSIARPLGLLRTGSSYSYLGVGANRNCLYSNGTLAIQSDTAGIEFCTGNSLKAVLDSSGRLGIGTQSPGTILDVVGTGNPTLTIRGSDLAYTGILNIQAAGGGMSSINATGGSNALKIETNSVERARIDSSGRLLVGTVTARTNLREGTDNETPQLQFETASEDYSNAGLSLINNSANGYAPILWLGRSNGTSIGANNLIASGRLGAISFNGADGTNFIQGARIQAETDGTTGSGDMPTRLVFSTTADGASSPATRFVIKSDGYIYVQEQGQAEAFNTFGPATQCAFYVMSSANFNAANTGMKIGRNSSTLRSINAGGTVNASGADYAEYMVKAGDFTIAKGAVCGVTADGLLTLDYGDAVSFVVKSTNPSYVGGDTWGSEDVIGKKPEVDDAEALAQWEADLEAVRQTVDRIAFAGQVPVNVMGATPGQYIVPAETADGGIEGIAKNEADLTLADYMRAVGKVIAIEDDGRARIIVKVA